MSRQWMLRVFAGDWRTRGSTYSSFMASLRMIALRILAPSAMFATIFCIGCVCSGGYVEVQQNKTNRTEQVRWNSKKRDWMRGIRGLKRTGGPDWGKYSPYLPCSLPTKLDRYPVWSSVVTNCSGLQRRVFCNGNMAKKAVRLRLD